MAFYEAATKTNGATFMCDALAANAYRVHTVLTDDWAAFAEQPRYRGGFGDRYCGGHIFERVCQANGIEHRLTKPYHPWTNRQAGRMNRMAKDATVKAFHYSDLDALQVCSVPESGGASLSRQQEDALWQQVFMAQPSRWQAAYR